MVSRRSSPWIYHRSRQLIGAIALFGAILTAYLTVVKLTGGTPACPTRGCEQVLSSPYATLFGLPLTLFGFLGYGAIALLALFPLVIDSQTQQELRRQLEKSTWGLLLTGAIAMVVFSGYLMYVLAFTIKVLCLYCIASALFSLTLFVLTLVGHEWEDLGQVAFTTLIVGMITLTGTLGVYANVQAAVPPTNPESATVGDSITTTSGPAEIALARHLSQIGAKMYGAFWCPHCFDQKQFFGKAAFAQIEYIECDPNGKNAKVLLCQVAGIAGYPTWEINGQKYEGVLSLQRLAELSGYQGANNFSVSSQ